MVIASGYCTAGVPRKSRSGFSHQLEEPHNPGKKSAHPVNWSVARARQCGGCDIGYPPVSPWEGAESSALRSPSSARWCE